MNPFSSPCLYQVNTRVLLSSYSRTLHRPATLDDVPDAFLDAIAAAGLDWIWWLSVWQTGAEARQVSRQHPGWRSEYVHTLPDLSDDDIGGSGFAITDYRVHDQLGGDAALARLRERMARRGLKLMLDYVPNHLGLGHHWIRSHPERFVHGTEADLACRPQNYTRTSGHILAYGRDPHFDGWPDTVQLNFAEPTTAEAMTAELERIAQQCDGVRCDMAMLLEPEIYQKTWGRSMAPFWPQAIQRARARQPSFVFLAEVYWNRERALLEQGFDFAYDKRLYDHLRAGKAHLVRKHLLAHKDEQRRLVRFLENHDEQRAATLFDRPQHEAAAILAYLLPGMRFFHQGQFEGWTKRISPHLVRGPEEPCDDHLAVFYHRLLSLLQHPIFDVGKWSLLDVSSAREGLETPTPLLVYAWEQPGVERWLVVVNYAPHVSQGRIHLPFVDLAGSKWQLRDWLSSAVKTIQSDEPASLGLPVELPAWGYHLYRMEQMS